MTRIETLEASIALIKEARGRLDKTVSMADFMEAYQAELEDELSALYQEHWANKIATWPGTPLNVPGDIGESKS